MQNKILAGIIVFLCGAVVMAFEIVGSRLLGPYTGTSITVWTAIITIIVAGLSAGYWLGGRLGDKYPDHRLLAALIFSSAIFMILIWLLKNSVLLAIIRSVYNPVLAASLASASLFLLPSVLLGTVAPFVTRLLISRTELSGFTAGNIYAVSTIGSIAGTFVAGFFLIPAFRVSLILIVFSVILTFVSLLIIIFYKKK